MKILIAGAGIGGLYAAYLLGKQGHTVTVFEKSVGLESMRYDWHDDVSYAIFQKLGLKVPKESFPKRDWTFVSPNGNTLTMQQKAENLDYSIERRPLNNYLYSLAAEYAEIKFGIEVEKALTKQEKVCGLVIVEDGKKVDVYGDLIVDSCGVLSKIRESLPTTMKVLKKISPNDVFVAYRAFFESTGAEFTQTNRVYMKHLGELGISWCLLDKEPNSVNVLVGRIGNLSEKTLTNALEKLREDNPVLSEKLTRGGIVTLIPVRRPLSMFVADGYAAIGDAACMTVPMIGSGIGTSLLAAKHLSDALENADSADLKTLWKYQTACYLDFGAQHCGVDYVKNWLLKRTDEEINWIFGSGILSNEDLQESSVGRMVKLSANDMMKKLRIGIDKLPLLVKMGNMMAKAQTISGYAEKIPVEYDAEKVDKWINGLNKYYK